MARFTEIRSGAIPVMLTPFDDWGAVNYDTVDAMVDFYIDAGVSAIFAICLSGEMFHLTPEERYLIAGRVCRRANGAIAIVASGNFEGSLEDQAAGIRAMHDTGVDAVVVLPSMLPSQESRLEQLMRLSDLAKAPLGLYECPGSARIPISAEEIAQIAPSGRYIFMKEISSDLNYCISKIRAAADTSLKVFIANLHCTPGTLKAGGAGHCGITANVCPEHCVAMCSDPDPEVRDGAYQSAQLMHDTMCACDYLPAAKYLLTRRGLNLGDRCRNHSNTLSEHARRLMDETISRFDFVHPLPTDVVAELRAMLDQAYPRQS